MRDDRLRGIVARWRHAGYAETGTLAVLQVVSNVYYHRAGLSPDSRRAMATPSSGPFGWRKGIGRCSRSGTVTRPEPAKTERDGGRLKR